MSQGARELLVAIAQSVAVDQRVLLVGDDFEVIQRLAALAVKELVVVSALADPDAPEGTTLTGAPLRLRPDWKERANSKDVVIDLDGTAPADQIKRILKKAGVYVTSQANAATAALPFQREVSARQGVALVIGDPEAVVLVASPTGTGASVVLAGKTEPSVPTICAVLDGGGADPEAVVAAERAITALEAERDSLADALKKARATEATRPALTERATRAEGLAAAREGELLKLRTEFETLEQAYSEVRDAASGQKIDDGRVKQLRERLEILRVASAAEVTELRDRLRLVEAPAEDVAQLLAARNTARAAYQQTAAGLAQAIATVRPGWPASATPTFDAEQLAEWIAAHIEAAATSRSALEAANARMSAVTLELNSARLRAHELSNALEARPAVTQTKPESVPAATADDERVAALERALAAERALRVAERAAIERAKSAASLAQQASAANQAEMPGIRLRAAQAVLAQVRAEEDARLVRAEAQLQSARIEELESMLSAHSRIQGLLADGLRLAESTRDDAEAEARIADANLATLRAEFERLQPAGVDRNANASARADRKAQLATQRELADAQRKVSALEEQLRRVTAERKLRAAQ